MAITASLNTVVRNVSGKTLSFGCFPRSKRLTPGQHHTIPGCLLTAVQGNKRKLQALSDALTSTKLAIVSAPNPVLYDEILDKTSMVTVSNGSVVASDPSWGGYSSSIDGQAP
jgi:hypothetical protein